MRKTMMIVLAASLFAASVPAMAMEHPQMKNTQHDEQCRKDCDMLLRNCGQEVYSIQERIKRLQQAIQDNSDQYTREQLKKLRDNLKDTERTLAELERGGA